MAELALSRYSDDMLVLSAIAGDFASFDELVNRYRDAVLRTVRRIVPSKDRAEDIVQEALVLAFERLPQLTAPGAFGGWVRTIAIRHARRKSRQDRSREDALSPMGELMILACPALTPDPEESLVDSEEKLRIRDALDRLPPKHAETLELRFFHDMPLARIASFQGITTDGVKWRLKRAVKLLKEEIGSATDPEAGDPAQKL